MNIKEIFEAKLQEAGVKFSKIEDELYQVEIDGDSREICITNLIKNVTRDQDPTTIERFVENITQSFPDLPSWNEAKSGLYLSLEPTNEPENCVYEDLSKACQVMLCLFFEKQNQIRFITHSDLEEWNINKDEAWSIAAANLEKIMENTSINFEDINGDLLGMVEAHEPYKASLILTQSLREKIDDKLSAALAVAPARDFVYVVSKSSSLINKLGAVVKDEFNNSGYPISPEVWDLSETPIKAIGAFPV